MARLPGLPLPPAPRVLQSLTPALTAALAEWNAANGEGQERTAARYFGEPVEAGRRSIEAIRLGIARPN